ncbi:MAG: CBS domain-containing protein, partial [Saprospiraceae bacterium]
GDTVKNAFNLMKTNDISQMPVLDGDNIVGSISETQVLNYLLDNPMQHAEKEVRNVMGAAFPKVSEDLPISKLSRFISKEIPAFITTDRSGGTHIVTQYDLIQAM